MEKYYIETLEKAANSMMNKTLDESIHERHKEISVILAELTQEISSLKLIPFGSYQYGLVEAESNFNFFIFTSKPMSCLLPVIKIIAANFYFTDDSKPARPFSGYYYSLLHRTDIHNHFDEISTINGNRSIRQQISLVHKASGIRCLLLMDNIEIIPKSSEIILQYVQTFPKCNNMTVIRN